MKAKPALITRLRVLDLENINMVLNKSVRTPKAQGLTASTAEAPITADIVNRLFMLSFAGPPKAKEVSEPAAARTASSIPFSTF